MPRGKENSRNMRVADLGAATGCWVKKAPQKQLTWRRLRPRWKVSDFITFSGREAREGSKTGAGDHEHHTNARDVD